MFKFTAMKKLLIFLLLFVVSVVHAQLLWQVTGKHVKTPSFILGTHALVPASAIDSVPGVYKAFAKCNVILSKYDVFSSDAISSLKNASLLPFDQHLSSLMPDSSAKKLDTELKLVLKMGLKELGRLHPVIIRQMYLEELFALSTKLKDDVQSDAYFQRIAAVKGLPVFGVEDYNVYIENVFKKSDLRTETNQLLMDVRNKNKIMSILKDLFSAYKRNDLTLIEKILTENGRYLNLSNINNSSRLDNHTKELIGQNSCFYVVNVSDLYGENSLLKQLMKDGYDVKPYPGKRGSKRK